MRALMVCLAVVVPFAAARAGPVDLPAGVADLDADGDGSLARAEWLAGTDPLMAKLDRDGDGRLDLAELSAGALALFDKDGDRWLQPAELTAALAEQAGEGAIDPSALRGGLAEMGLSAWDADGDGTLSGTELAAARAAAFDTGDRNGDGRLDRLEIYAKRLRLLVDGPP